MITRRAQRAALVAQGLTMREIAAQLGVSATTVRRRLRKYGLDTRRTRRLRETGPARAAGSRSTVAKLCAPRPRYVHQIAHGRISLPQMPRRGGLEAAPGGEGGPRCRGGWSVRLVRLLPKRGCASVSPRGADTQSVQHLGAGGLARAGKGTRRGQEVRPSLRELPRGSGGRSSYTAREVEHLTLRVSSGLG